MKAAVIVFPGSNCDRDLAVALEMVGFEVSKIWHKDSELERGIDLVAIPGGFSFGDYLRVGAIAANSPICKSIISHAERGGYIVAPAACQRDFRRVRSDESGALATVVFTEDLLGRT